MNRPLRIGIIGCGVIGPTHCRCFRTCGADLSWVCDVQLDKARRLAGEFEVANVTDDYHDLLKDQELDAVAVCTDHASHAQLVVAALEAGKHVICEKSPAANREGMDQMIQAHGAHPDLVASVVFQHRFDPANRLLRELIQEGVFGRLLTAGVNLRCLRTDDYYRADAWRGTWWHEGGAVLINQAIHFIDQLIWQMGPAASLTGMYANLTHSHTMETEDTAAAVLRFPTGVIGTVEATCSSHLKWEHTISLHGTNGSVELRQDKPQKLEFDNSQVTESVATRFEQIQAEQERKALGRDYYGKGHVGQIADFLDAIQAKRKPFVTLKSAQHTLDVVLAIYESQRSGNHVTINPGR